MRSCASAMVKSLALMMGMVIAAPASAKEAKVLVVPIHGKAGPAFDASVIRYVEKPLKRRASLIAPTALKAAAKKAHIRLAALRSSKNLRKLGKATGANYVLIIEATGRKPHWTASTVLIDVQSGRTLHTGRYNLIGGRLTAASAQQIVSPVLDKLGGGGGDDAGSAADADAVDAPAKPVGHKDSSKNYTWPSRNAQGGTDDNGGDPTEPAATNTSAATDDAGASGGNSDTSSEDGMETTAHDPGEHGDKWRPAFRLSLGADFLQRDAHINTANKPASVTTLPCYCGTAHDSNPFFPAAKLSAEFFPFAIHGHGDAIEGLGLHLELFATQVKSFVTTTDPSATTNPNTTVISSNLFEFRGGATYRLVFWDSLTAPDVYFNLGYGVFTFPLSAGGFPGVTYSSPYLGVMGHIPLGIQELSLIAGGNFMLHVTAGDNAATELGAQSGGNAFNLDAGLRFAYDRWEITALGRYQMYNVSYTGMTNLPATAAQPGSTITQLSNVSLSDRYLEILITGGVVF